MTTFQQLQARYMDVGSTGSTGTRPPAIPIATGNRVTALIHGRQYFAALKSAIDRLGSANPAGQFIYLMGWWFDATFSLDNSAALLSDLLKAKARAGADVRVMGWVMAPEVLQDARLQRSANPEITDMVGLNNETFAFVQALRAEPALAHKALLNILSHPAGAVHMKFAVIGDGSGTVGFTGGIDAQSFRHHAAWHDVAARVEGPVVQEMFGAFREQWNEIRGRSPVRLTIGGTRGGVAVTPITGNSHTPSTPDLPSRTLVVPAIGQMHVQSLTTLPRMNFSTAHGLLSLPTNRPISYAPNGRFHVRDSWLRALGAAHSVIYIEDQAFTAAELFDRINAGLKQNDTLHVILVIGGPDPNGGNASLKDFQIAINNHLLAGLSAAQRGRVGIFRRVDSFTLPNGRTIGLVVHPKTTLIDDCWALIGSANMMRRSLYTDLEHSVAFMDENSNAGVIAVRRALWSEHLGSSPADLAAAIAAWFAIAEGTTSGKVERVRLPLPAATRTTQEQIFYDEISDPDSRQAWGGVALIQLITGAGGGNPGSGG